MYAQGFSAGGRTKKPRYLGKAKHRDRSSNAAICCGAARYLTAPLYGVIMHHMLQDSDTLDLKDLAASSGVSVRTIRFYQQQGLLAAPGQRGPGAKYGASDLDRLRLIRLLQREHLPLAEVRKRLEVMTDDEVALAVRLNAPPVERSTAADYARRVLDEAPHKHFAARRAPEPLAEQAGQAPGALSGMMSFLRAPRAPDEESRSLVRSARQSRYEKGAPNRLTRESWERVEIAPDVELHIRRPLSRAQNRLVEQLLAAAQRHMEQEELP